MKWAFLTRLPRHEEGFYQMASDLDKIIPGEISNDQFFFSLQKLVSLHSVMNILEIGSSSGAGSTQAFVEAIRARPDISSVSLFCVEVSKDRLQKLKNTYATDPFIKAYNVSSISTDEFPSTAQILRFFLKE